MTEDTKQRLRDAALACLIEHGIAGTSTRVVGERAGVKHALIHYHFGNLDGLLADTATAVTRRRAAVYRQRLAEVTTFAELAATARALHEEERHLGTVAALAQLLAGVPSHPALRPALADNFALLADEVRAALDRLLVGSPLEGQLDTARVSRSVAAGFLGLELMDVADVADGDPLSGLDDLARLVDLVLDAGVVSRAVLRRRLRA